MDTFLQTATENLLSLFGYSNPSPNVKLLGKVAIIGGAIGVSTVIALFPATFTIQKSIKIEKSGKEVFDFLKETPAEKLWPILHPNFTDAQLKEEYNNTQKILITQSSKGAVGQMMINVVKKSESQIVTFTTHCCCY